MSFQGTNRFQIVGYLEFSRHVENVNSFGVLFNNCVDERGRGSFQIICSVNVSKKSRWVVKKLKIMSTASTFVAIKVYMWGPSYI